MADNLTAEQEEQLALFQSVTGLGSTEDCLIYLRNHNWDMETAVSTALYAAESVAAPPPARPVTRASNGVASTSGIYDATPPSAATDRTAGPQARGQPSLIRRVLGLVGLSESDTETTSAHAGRASQRFLTQFEREYGDDHVSFSEGIYREALTEARNVFKFLVVYLHSPWHENTPAFCRDILCSEQFRNLAAEHYVVWAGNIKESEPFQLAGELGASTYPFLAVLDTSSTTVSVIETFEGELQAERLYQQLQGIVENQGPALVAARADDEANARARAIREEQEREYQEAMRADLERMERDRQERERQEAEAAAARAAEEAAQREAAAALVRRENKAQAIPDPPAAGEPGATIQLRMPDGSKKRRRFHLTDTIGTIMDYIDVQGVDLQQYQLITNFPKKVYDDWDQTVEDAGLAPQAMLIVSEKVEGAEE